MSVAAVTRLAPIVTTDDLQHPERIQRTRYDAGSLEPLHIGSAIPVVVNHDKGRVVGHVREFTTNDDSGGGRWIWAHCLITDAPAWLQRNCGASFAYNAVHSKNMGGWELIRRAAVTEISLLSPTTKPAEPRARVVWIGEPVASPEPPPSIERHAAREIHHPPGAVLVRPGLGKVVGIR